MDFTSYNRLKTALEHSGPDKVPFDIGGTMVSGVNIKTMQRLREHLILEGEAVVHDTVTQMARTDDDLIQKLKVDVKNVGPRPPNMSRVCPGIASFPDTGRIRHLILSLDACMSQKLDTVDSPGRRFTTSSIPNYTIRRVSA